MKRLLAPAALAAAAAILLAACGSDEGSASRGTATTVATKRIGGKTVLIDADGMALYTSEQEAGGPVRCTGACLEFWEPLTINGGQPSGMVAGGALGVLTRPDGVTQVTFNGVPVYRFTEDQSRSVKGDGLDDAVDGQQFAWHVVTTGGEPSAPATTSGSGGIPGY